MNSEMAALKNQASWPVVFLYDTVTLTLSDNDTSVENALIHELCIIGNGGSSGNKLHYRGRNV